MNTYEDGSGVFQGTLQLFTLRRLRIRIESSVQSITRTRFVPDTAQIDVITVTAITPDLSVCALLFVDGVRYIRVISILCSGTKKL